MAYVTANDFGRVAAPAQKGFFGRILDRLIAARMREAERHVEHYLAMLPACDRDRVRREIQLAADRQDLAS